MTDDRKVNEDKRRVVAELSEKLTKAQGVILAGYQGLSVADLTQLRMKLRQIQGELRILQNRLTRIAIKETGQNAALNKYLTGPTAAIITYGDPVLLAKVVKEFAGEKDRLKIKAGLVSGRFLESPDVSRLASMPGRQALIYSLVGLLSSPLRRLVTALSQPQRQLVQVLAQVGRKKESTAK